MDRKRTYPKLQNTNIKKIRSDRDRFRWIILIFFIGMKNIIKGTSEKLWKKCKWLSFRRNDVFVRNMVLVLGAVFIWRWVWNILDYYFFPYNRLASNLLSIWFGVFLVFLLDEEIKHERRDSKKELSHEQQE